MENPKNLPFRLPFALEDSILPFPGDCRKLTAQSRPEAISRFWALYSLFPDQPVEVLAPLCGISAAAGFKYQQRYSFPPRNDPDFLQRALDLARGFRRLPDDLPDPGTPRTTRKTEGTSPKNECPGPAVCPHIRKTLKEERDRTPPTPPGIDFLIARCQELLEAGMIGADVGELSTLLSSLTRAAESARGRVTQTGRTLTQVAQEIYKRREARHRRRQEKKKLAERIEAEKLRAAQVRDEPEAT